MRQRGWKIKMRLTWTKSLFFFTITGTYIVPLILQNIKTVPLLVFVILAIKLSSAGAADIKHYNEFTLLSYNSCSISQTYWAIREREEAAMFQEKSTLFCQIEMIKLLALAMLMSNTRATFSTSLRVYTEINIPSN